MFPPKQSKPVKTRTGILIEEWLLLRLDGIVELEANLRSRNQAITQLLVFATDAYEGLRDIADQVEAFREKEGVSYGLAVAKLVERGLKVKR